MKKLFKEPFFHFIGIGAALFLLYGLVNDKTDSKNTIIINDFDVSSLISKWETMETSTNRKRIGKFNQTKHQTRDFLSRSFKNEF